MTGKKNLNGVEYERIYIYKESLVFEINVLKILEQSQKSYKNAYYLMTWQKQQEIHMLAILTLNAQI